MTYLLDTNVLSEPLKPKPDVKVTGWLNSVPQDQLYISVLTLGEIRKGVEMKADGKRRQQLAHWLESALPDWFDDRMVPVDAKVAECWGVMTARAGRPLAAIDGLIAASCLTYGLTLVTRNEKDYDVIDGLKILNPWNN